MPDRNAASPSSTVPDVATPPGRPQGLAGLTSSRVLTLLAARLAAWFARLVGGPFQVGSLVIAARHCDVEEVLGRDLDFLIKPINAVRFDQIGYHFVLGMDRGCELGEERHALYAALAAVD